MASSPWIVVFAGVVVMVVLLVIVLGTYRGRSDAEVPRGLEVGAPMPTPPWLSASPTGSASADSTGGTRSPSSSPSSSPTLSSTPSAPASPPSPSSVLPGSPSVPASPRVSTAPPAPPAPPAQPELTGRYRVTSTFSGGFIAEVQVSNESGAGQEWQVRLGFSGGRVTTAWVVNAPQGRLRENDDIYTYSGGADLAPGQSARLMFHVERAETRPAECAVNGVTCGGL
ncbi:cellulose binding domain-containing protein [Micromonospora musae]|uniref:cellulose binding domain-containing protein n=1 Tax=Micromonospora musae TaxID=1894970 RepID=UPI0011C43777|nr:cellulose binding domain-containing protein [Micromonospora musae]